MSRTLWITRHGNRYDFVHPEWFKTADRPYDPHLANDGFIQAKETGQRLQGENIAHIFSSPFLRTVQTAFEIAEILNLSIKLEAGLSEWLNPEWMHATPETLPIETLARDYPRIDTSYRSRVLPQYPESGDAVMIRTAETARILTADYSGNLLFVGHGASVLGTTRGLLNANVDINAALCCLVKLVSTENTWHLELNGDTSHLSHRESTIRFN